MSESADEREIRALVQRWMQASTEGDLETILSLMADDVLFMVPGREPFGKEAFTAQSTGPLRDVRIEGTSRPVEIRVLGDWAYMRAHLSISATPPGGRTTHRSGYTLTILQRLPGRGWVIARDANLLSAAKG